MGELQMDLVVNGKRVRKPADPDMRLLDFLRERLFLTGTKEGCGEGECGACTVIIDGQPIKSCLMPVAKAQGTHVLTVEGLLDGDRLHPVQEAFLHKGAAQCGFCTPGMVMSGVATLMANPEATADELREGVAGNICRCTGYQKIFEALELAREIQAGRVKPEDLAAPPSPSYIGASVRRIDGRGKLTGATKYAADLTLPGMLHVKVLRSPYAHARILDIDTAEAEAMPGVEAVLTWKDIPGRNLYGAFIPDQPVFCRDKVRFIGDAVAAVVAESEEIARQALARIRVHYDVLPAVFDPEEAMRPGAPVLHDDVPDNVVKRTKLRRGDAEAAMAAADVVVEGVYQTQAIEHAYLEPEAGVAYLEPDETITILAPGQNLTHHREDLCAILKLPVNRVRLIMSTVGGGFGGKEDLTVQPILALSVMRTRRPAKYVFTREESFLATAKRHPFRVYYRTGLQSDGRIAASEIRVVADGGAYAQSSPGVMVKATILGAGPYCIPNVSIDAAAVYTNNTPSGAMRGFGATQMNFATEVHMDRCAERLGMDPIAFRRLNAMRDGAITHTGQVLPRVTLLESLEAAAAAAGWAPRRAGAGAAVGARVREEVTRS